MPGRSRGNKLKSKSKFSGGDNLDSETSGILNRLHKAYKNVDAQKDRQAFEDNRAQKETDFQHWVTKEGIKQGWQANPSEITIQLRNMAIQFIEKSIPYVVLFLVIGILFMGFSGGFSFSTPSPSNSVIDIKETEQMIRNQFSGWFGSIYLFFYKIWNSIKLPAQIKRLLNSYSQYSDGGPVVPRTLIDSGRCDNVQWIETTEEGKSGTCTSAIRPQDLTWKLDPQLNSEFYPNSPFLNYAKDNKIKTSQWTNNKNVIIPWDRSPETTFFVPQCEQAYFANQCRTALNSDNCENNEHWANGHCCVKANLLKEQGLTCGLASFNLGNKNINTKNFDKNTEKSPVFTNITKINQTAPKLNPTGSPLFVNIGENTASGAASTFLGTRL